MQVDITASCGSLDNVCDSAPLLFSLLANVDCLTVVGDVLLHTKRQQFRDADAAPRKKRGSHLIPAQRIRYNPCHLLTRQRGTVLLLLVHCWQANERKIPVTRMHLICIVIDCRPRSVVAESVLVRHQLRILNRSRKRAPNLRATERSSPICVRFS
jgi:hypothetical protein